MSSRKIEDCDQRLQDVWSKALPMFQTYHPDITPFITCSYRSPAEQDALYAQGRTKAGNVVTNAQGLHSAHNFIPAQAFDIAFRNPDKTVNWSTDLFTLFAEIVGIIDNTIISGGKWKTIKDMPHFETPDWRKLIPSA